METCAERIRTALWIRNMKQSELAERTGIPKSAISQYCSGAFKPKQQRLFRIAEVLEVDEAWLMGLDVPMERNTSPNVQSSLPTENTVRIAGRDGSFREETLSDKELAALIAFLDLLPDAPEGL